MFVFLFNIQVFRAFHIYFLYLSQSVYFYKLIQLFFLFYIHYVYVGSLKKSSTGKAVQTLSQTWKDFVFCFRNS